jgi:hypothetical protein
MPTSAKTECEILQSANVKVFTFNNLKAATRNFRPDSVLGEGGFGSVYKGWIDENTLSPCRPGTGIAVAVKKLNPEGLQGHREWLVSIMLFYFMLLPCESTIVHVCLKISLVSHLSVLALVTNIDKYSVHRRKLIT